MVVDPSVVIEDVSKYEFDQIAILAMKNGKFAIWSSHPVEEMENLIDDALDALENDEILDPDELDGE